MGVHGLAFDCSHLEAHQTKTCAPEPPAGRFPKFLLPRAAGRPRELKFTLSVSSPTLVRVVGGEWNSGLPGGSSDFPGLHMPDWYAPITANWRQGRRNNEKAMTETKTGPFSPGLSSSRAILGRDRAGGHAEDAFLADFWPKLSMMTLSGGSSFDRLCSPAEFLWLLPGGSLVSCRGDRITAHAAQAEPKTNNSKGGPLQRDSSLLEACFCLDCHPPEQLWAETGPLDLPKAAFWPFSAHVFRGVPLWGVKS